MKSLVVIAPAALWPTVRAVNAALGYDAGDGVPLSPSGEMPETHRGLHTWAADEFVALATGQAPAAVPGFAPEQVAAFLAVLAVSVEPDGRTGSDHFDHACALLGVLRISDEG